VRQGAGVFVAEKESRTFSFEIDRNDEIRSAMQILELRLGVEMQSVALAALRRTPETLAEIARAYDHLDRLVTDDVEIEARADFDFHLAIARATRNPHFTRFLEAVANEINLDLLLKHRRTAGVATKPYLKKLSSDHAAILSAITRGDPKAARAALVRHLEESLERYKRLLNEIS
jgi:DNA-binding FadR family transcriptional regulator